MSFCSHSYYYRSTISHGNPRHFWVTSILFHLFLMIAALVLSKWQPGVFNFGGGEAGGGGSVSSIGVGLTGALPAGEDYYKPPAHAIPAAAPTPQTFPENGATKDASENEKPEPPRPDDLMETQETVKKRPSPEKSQKAIPSSLNNRIATAEKALGVRGGQAPVGSGASGNVAGSGTGVSLGMGAGSGSGNGTGSGTGTGGNGIYDSWYGRQVEAKVSANWLRSRMGIQFSGKHQVIIEFFVTSEGRIVDIRIIQSTGAEALERSAIRAIKASDPLPPIPFQYRSQANRLSFTAVFDYPSPQ